MVLVKPHNSETYGCIVGQLASSCPKYACKLSLYPCSAQLSVPATLAEPLQSESVFDLLQANELDLALDVYAQLVREGCTPNLVTFNILIDIYGKTSQWQEAVKVLDALQAQVLPGLFCC